MTNSENIKICSLKSKIVASQGNFNFSDCRSLVLGIMKNDTENYIRIIPGLPSTERSAKDFINLYVTRIEKNILSVRTVISI